MASLKSFKVVGDEQFLQEQESFFDNLQPQDLKAVQKKYIIWLQDPHYNSLETKKMHRPGQEGFFLWESRMTKKIRLRFMVNEEKQVRVPVSFDMHDDRNDAMDRVMAHGIMRVYNERLLSILMVIIRLAHLPLSLWKDHSDD